MTEMRKHTPVPARPTKPARLMRACGSAILLAVALVAACDQEPVGVPPAAIAPGPEAIASLAAAPTSDRDILIALYEATDGANWVNNDNWLTDAPLREWHGVTVNGDGRVTELRLTQNRLSGTIPAELDGLAELESVSFFVNRLSGSIPPTLGNLVNLQTLWLSANDLTGPIPPELARLANVSQLGLAGNALSGAIPSELGGLANLDNLDLSGNQLSGMVPSELGGLTKLQDLALHRNQLSGTVPLSFLQLSRLTAFTFARNAGLCLTSDLVDWYEAIEHRSGEVCPDAEVLRELYEATGGGGWTNSEGWLEDGPLGDWYGVDVDADGRVSTVDLERNGLSGSLPGNLGDLAGLTTLRIGDNALSGRLPASLSRTPLQELRYANTDLCAPAEGWFQDWLAAIPQHEGTGVQCPPLPDRKILSELYHATDGANWVNNDNWLTDAPLGEWHGVTVNEDGRVTKLRLAQNRLSGTIPTELDGLAELEVLTFWVNELSGSIPSTLGNLVNLQTLWLSSNDLTGPVPPELARLANLSELGLAGNALSGMIPSELGGLVNLDQLDLGGNQLSGTVPSELGGLANLEHLRLSRNQLSGTVPLSFLQLSRLTEFTFARNDGLCLTSDLVVWYEAIEHRSGDVCPDADVLRDLYEATGGGGWTNSEGWLEDGPLGDWYGVAVDADGRVSTVDLERNGLSGSLPGRLGDLARLTTLRIGDNALSGRLPTSLSRTRLQELRYANTDLCVPVWLRAWLATIPQHEGTGIQCPPPTDREILTELYHATGGPDWENSDNWVTDVPLEEWHGVETNAEGRVTSLDLQLNGLEGSIPPELGGLAELETLILFLNDLTGPIPPALGGLAKVQLVVLAGNGLSGPIPPELGSLASVEELYLNGNEFTSVPQELGGLRNLVALSLNFNRLTSIPPELGGLSRLEYLGLWSNELTSVPVELGALGSLRELDLDGNRLTDLPLGPGGYPNLKALFLSSNEFTSFPPGLGSLGNLEALFFEENRLSDIPPGLGGMASLELLVLSSNEFTSLPRELGELRNLQVLRAAENRLAAIPSGLGGMARLWVVDLSSNELTSFPRELGELGNLRQLELDGNRLTDIPTGLGGSVSGERLTPSASEWPSTVRTLSEPRARGRPDEPWRLDFDDKLDTWGTLRMHMGRGRSRSADARQGVGGLAGLEILDLSSNELSGPLPAGLVEFTGLTSLGLAGNAGLAGALPLDMMALEGLEDLHTTGTSLCAPRDPAFLDWLDGVTRQRVSPCDPGDGAAAYLTQVVQSREFPVPLVAGEPALLRVFLTAEQATGATMPPVRATFYRDGIVIHQVDIPAKPDPIPTSIDESSLSKSVNAEIPGSVIQPGLEVVIEPDPDGTLDPALGVAGRIPATGRMAVDVRAMPVFEVTLVPFIWEQSPDHSILEITAAMAADPEGHELWARTHVLLPVSALDARAHGSVMSSTNNGFEILEQTEMIRVMEGGRGHYLGVMAGPTGPGGLGGVAYDIGSWSSFSKLNSEIIAHEFGHNRNLYHAPACGAGGPDRYYPYKGTIGAWGYDFSTGELVPPSRWDFMSYCDPTWISDYQFTNALRYRLETESNSIVVTAAASAASSSSSPALVVWGGLDGDGAPYLRPAFLADAPPAPPSGGGAWSLTGRDAGGAELFSVSFEMAEFTDTADDRAGFVFALPVTWTGELASIALQGPNGAASLDGNTDDPVTILRDEATGHIRAILDGPPPTAPVPGLAAAQGQGIEVLFSRGIPDAEDGSR